MNRARPKRKILLVLPCVIALLALGPVTAVVGGNEVETEPRTAGVTTTAAEGAAVEETASPHGRVVRGLPFTSFDLLALGAVLLGLTTISFATHRLNLEPSEPPAQAPVTTDAE